MSATVALAGDTMLGRGVAEAIGRGARLFSGEVADLMGGADLTVVNLECCVSSRGERWPDPRKPFFFRAPPEAARILADLGVDCVTLANNHALDYGEVALLDTLDHLHGAGIAVAGAGGDEATARHPVRLEVEGLRLSVIGFTDHPASYAAGQDRPGVAYADLGAGLPDWLVESIRGEPDAVLVTPHWGPNMTAEPLPYVRAAAEDLSAVGPSLVAGHSAHVFHGVAGDVIYDMGDFIDDYAVDARLRNDLGLLYLVDLGVRGVERIEAVPIALDFCHTRLAHGREVEWIVDRFVSACAAMGTAVHREEDRLVIRLTTGH